MYLYGWIVLLSLNLERFPNWKFRRKPFVSFIIFSLLDFNVGINLYPFLWKLYSTCWITTWFFFNYWLFVVPLFSGTNRYYSCCCGVFFVWLVSWIDDTDAHTRQLYRHINEQSCTVRRPLMINHPGTVGCIYFDYASKICIKPERHANIDACVHTYIHTYSYYWIARKQMSLKRK